MVMRAVAVVLAAAFFAGCASAPRGVVQTPTGPIIDGWHVGVETGGPGIDGIPCGDDQIIQAAINALARRDPGHPEVVDASIHAERFEPGGALYGGEALVVVFQLADESLRAIGVRWILCSGTPDTINFGTDLPRA